MPNKGQIISFFIVFAVIVVGAWQAVSHGEGLKEAKGLAQPAFIAQQQEQQLPIKEPSQEPEETIDAEAECETEECMAEVPDVAPDNIERAALLIDDGSDNPRGFALTVSASTTAFDLLQEASLSSGFAIESEEYDFGVFIEAINGRRNRQDNKYWLFYVNGGLSQLTPDKVIVNPEDKIEFIFTNR